ncbi:OppA family ABC transporter substrate-binding lipoprotein [Mycoplasmopsis primatum]|uniref:OppA family ABC transporter substrate-binding lipoprotein n=1 Tax=Mycoplasmopsis primatum TaxID=55604 RepID=UPI0004964E6B|nr:variable surface lipoprotein [Mycoplasmopsis primatum]
MSRKNKLLLTFGALSTTAVLPLIAASCGKGQSAQFQELTYERWNEILKDEKSLWNYDLEVKPYSKNDAKLPIGQLANGVLRQAHNGGHVKNTEYTLDRTASYGSWQNQPTDSTVGVLLRKESLFTPIVFKTKDGKWINARPSVWRYKLELGSEVTLTYNDAGVEKTETFDNDIVDTFPEPDGGATEATLADGKTKTYNVFKFSYYQAFSSNEKSINSKKFADVLKKATKLQIGVKKGQKWVGRKGEETKYDIVPDDFWVSWLRTKGLTASDRVKLLEGQADKLTLKGEKQTSEQVDKFINEKILADKSKYFTANAKYPNEYLYSFYNVDSTKFWKKEDFIQNDKLTFVRKNTGVEGHFDLLFENLATSQDFTAAPSQYLAELDQDPTKINIQTNKNVQVEDDVKTLKELLSLVKGTLAGKAGIYWYGFNDDSILTAGRYYYVNYDEGTREEIYKLNTHYRAENPNDPIAVAKDKNKIKEHRLWYQGDSLNDTSFQLAVKTDYLNGDFGILSHTLLSKNDYEDMSLQQINNGVFYSRQSNATSGPYRFLTTYLPYSATHTADTQFNYNNNFAKLAYGSSLEEIRTGGKFQNLKDKFGAKTIAFRTMLTAAINWEYLASWVSEGESSAWLSHIAPNGAIKAKDNVDKIDQPEQHAKEFNSLFYLSADGKKAGTITPDQNIKKSSAQNDKDRIKSAEFEKIQAEIKKILDEYYTANNLDAQKDKVEWTVINRNAKTFVPPKMESLLQWLPELYSDLDPRLKCTFKKYDTKEEWAKNIASLTSFQEWAGWGYDLDDIGSGFDGLGAVSLRAILVLINYDIELQNSLKGSFPQLVKLAKAFVAFMNDPKQEFKWSVPFDKWKDVESKYWVRFNDSVESFKLDATGQVVENKEGGFTQIGAASAQFFVQYTKTINVKDVIALSNELLNYYGRVPEPDLLVSKNQYSIGFVNHYLGKVYSAADNQWLADYVIRNGQ